MFGQVRTYHIEEATKRRGFKITTEKDQVDSLKTLISNGYKPKDGKWVKDSRTL